MKGCSDVCFCTTLAWTGSTISWTNFFCAVILARESGRALVPTDMWPEWSYDLRIWEAHRPFGDFFSACALSAVAEVPIHERESVALRRCSEMCWYGDPARIKSSRLGYLFHSQVTTSCGLAKLDYGRVNLSSVDSPVCAAVENPCAVIRPRMMAYGSHAYRNSMREGSDPEFRLARAALRWSPRVLRLARHVLTTYENVPNLRRASRPRSAPLRVLGIHVRRGDYIGHGHCEKFKAIGLTSRSEMCPTKCDVATCIATSQARVVYLATNDAQFVCDVRLFLRDHGHDDITVLSLASALAGLDGQDLRESLKSDLFPHRNESRSAGDIAAVEQVLLQHFDAFVGVRVSSYSATVMSGRDVVNRHPWESTISYRANQSCESLAHIFAQ